MYIYFSRKIAKCVIICNYIYINMKSCEKALFTIVSTVAITLL